MRSTFQIALSLLLFSLALPGRAESPEALQSALASLAEEPAPVKARLETELWRAEGEGDDREETRVEVKVAISDGPRGFSVHYPPELLARLDEEARAEVDNPDAPDPVQGAMWRMDINQLRPLLSAAPSLARATARAQFRRAQADEYAGRPATRLIYERPREVVSENLRKYIKEFDSTLEIWIDEQGTPLASRILLELRGSLFFVVRGQYRERQVSHYRVHDGRLTVYQLDRWQKTDMPGEHHEVELKHRLHLSHTDHQDATSHTGKKNRPRRE